LKELSPQIRKVALVWLAAFALLALVAGYWQVIAAPALQDSPYNTREEERLSLTQPGTVYASDGTTVIMGAEKRKTGEGWEATYPDAETYCHLTGYNARSGLQLGLRDALLGTGRYANSWAALLAGRLRGDDVDLTIDAAAQKAAVEGMKGLHGAVVAIDPRDGAIRVLVSAPEYDPETLREPGAYDVFHLDPASPELDRALQGLYTPGSALKIMTAAIGLQAGVARPDTVYDCAPVEEVGGTKVVSETGVQGRLTMTQALARSCNVYFAKLGLSIGTDRFRKGVQDFHLMDPANRALVPLPSRGGGMADLTGARGVKLLVHTAYGQGETRVTPLAMARLAATIADGGEVVQPYLVAQVRDTKGRVVETGAGQDLGRACSAQTARQVAGMMVQVVENGTGRIMSVPGVKVAAKTGTAQLNGKLPDVWMLAFAPADKPTVVVAVVVEGGVSGAETAGPVAQEVLRRLLRGN
jgi:peptidoglycan glycosyltransferase